MQFSMGTEENNFKSSNPADAGKISFSVSLSVSFHQYFIPSSKICFRHLVLLVIICLKKYLKQPQRRLQYYTNDLGTKFLSACYSKILWILSLYVSSRFFNWPTKKKLNFMIILYLRKLLHYDWLRGGQCIVNF